MPNLVSTSHVKNKKKPFRWVGKVYDVNANRRVTRRKNNKKNSQDERVPLLVEPPY